MISARAYRLFFWLGLLVGLILALGLVQGILMPFATGFALAYILAPAVARMERWGIARSLASLAVLILFLLAVALILFILVPLIQGQVVQLIGRVPTLARTLQDQLGNLIQLLQEHLPAEDVSKVRDLVGAKLAEALTWIAGLVQGVITSSFAILNIISLVVVTPIVTFFLLRDWEKMVAHIDSCLPRQSLETVRGQARLISDTLVGFVHGQAIVCLILAVYYGVALSLAGLDSGLALGLLIGVLGIIPFLGAATGFLLSISLAASQYGTWSEIIIVGAIFAVGQLAEANFLTPKLIGDRVHLHPVWVIFALFAGGTLYGFIGVLIAVPAAAVIGVLARFALARYRASSLYDAIPAEAAVAEAVEAQAASVEAQVAAVEAVEAETGAGGNIARLR
ncbi:MAG TPA: AI-2E family transporter [Stellaceae bacterium]|nr:AI-2E family transporter [Stellaceae bacterium]